MKFKKFFFFNKIRNEFLKTKKIPKVDLHIHTNWTDGRDSVQEMADRACKLNLKAVLFSEHSRQSSKGWFNKFVQEIKESQKKTKNKCKLLIGTEVKVKDFKGTLDINQKIKKKCDLVMASVHRFPGETGNIMKNKSKIKKSQAIKIEYNLLLSAIKFSKADIIGHPFGMSIKRFKINPKWSLFQKIIEECKKNNKIFEINYHYHKNHKKLLKECIRSKTLFSLGSNAHKKEEIGKINKI